MKSETAIVARQCRLQEWAAQIQECRASGLTTQKWCDQNGITTANYYYRLREVRKAYLASLDSDQTEVENAQPTFVELNEPVAVSQPSSSVKIQIGQAVLSLDESISDSFLSRLLGAVSHVK